MISDEVIKKLFLSSLLGDRRLAVEFMVSKYPIIRNYRTLGFNKLEKVIYIGDIRHIIDLTSSPYTAFYLPEDCPYYD